MTTQQITLPIEYWKNDNTEVISIDDIRTVELKYFRDVKFTGHSIHYPQPLLYSRGKLLLPTIEKFMSLGRGTVYEKDMWYSGEFLEVKKTVEDPVFYFVYNMANYYHFIYDTLPYLYSYFYEKKYTKNLKLLVSPPEGQTDLYPFVWDCLDLLGISRDDIVFLDPETEYYSVLVGSSLTHDGLSNHRPHKGVYDVINRMRGDYSGPEKVYISRRTWTQEKSDNIGTNMTEARRCVNEDEVWELFKARGYEEVFCENLSMEEKIGLFRGAKKVAGPIGGGMVNTIFSPPETQVISINSPTFFDINTRFEYSMSHTKLYHFNDTEFDGDATGWVEGQGALSISGGLNSPWKVNLNTLSQFLEEHDG